MLGKLTIRCNFATKGCTQVVPLDELDIHLNSCLFNRKLCEKCNLDLMDGHNCVQELMKLNQNMESKLRDTSIRINSLEDENENYLQTIRELCVNANSNQILKVCNTSQTCFNYITSYCL